MKKIVSLLVLVSMLTLALCSCGSSVGSTDNTGPADTTDAVTLPDYVNQTIKEYDSEGNFLLTSTDNRIVYAYKSGYVVFTFLGQTVNKIQEVKSFKTEEEAAQFVITYMQENGKDGGNAFANGKNAVITCGADYEVLGDYYTMTKSAIISEFSSVESY